MSEDEKYKNSVLPPPAVIEKARRLLQQTMEANRKWVERTCLSR